LLTYSFGVIKWSKTNLQNINIQTRVLFTKFCKHHPKSAIERFNLPRENGGRGFSNLEILQHHQIASLKNYFLNRARDNTFFNETEGFIFAIQDRVINTRNYKKYICGLQSIIDKCRICGTEGETIEHIISSCTVLAQSEYKKRHDIFAKIIHMNLAVKFNLLKDTQPHYIYKPESCLENDNYKSYFDRTVLTDIHIQHNRPDIILPLIISATGIVPQSLFKNLKILDLGNTLVVEIQKGILLYSCHIVRKFLNIDTEHNTQQSQNTEAKRR
jgi:hypothetical protein